MPINDVFHETQRPVLIMDGGLGTALEDICQTRIAATSLWSAEALVKEPDAIIAAHLSFLRAGAEVIETSTYQCSLDTFKQAGYGGSEAWQFMREAVLLAHLALTLYEEERRKVQLNGEPFCNPRTRLCLSLGPFGASLKPTQEFGGFYPRPYGPREYSADGPNTNSMCGEVEEKAIEALAAFHSERLSLFTQDSEIWSYIDMIAFETVPLAREAISIRRAMARLQGNAVGKQWWISFVFPQGCCPQMVDSTGTRLTASDLVWAALSPELCDQHGGIKLPAPHGIGINCTNVEYLPLIVEEMEGACRAIRTEERQFLVLYPNGGDEFDESLGTWRSSVSEEVKSEWAIKLVDLVEKVLNSPAVNWSGVVVGGCCRCNAEQISRLRRMLK